MDLLTSYLELVKVPLPDWLIDPPTTIQVLPPPPPPPVINENVPQLYVNGPAKQQPRHEPSSNQIVNVSYSEPVYVVDVGQVDNPDRRKNYNQVEVVRAL